MTLECFQPGAKDPDAAPRPRAVAVESLGRSSAILCARCHAPLTTASARIEMMGLHEHECENPHGYRYRIGCFAVAPGCTPTSDPSSYWSWFPGWQWQIVACSACREHVGWKFVRADQVFFGLILDRIVEERPQPAS